jgi:hypothetical protein
MPLTVDISETYFFRKGEAETNRKVAILMLQAGKYDLEEITSLTGFSKSELIELRKEIEG